jgi:fatty-acyl-CoA synthase
MLPNTPEMVEAHCEARVLITGREFAPGKARELQILDADHGRESVVIDVCDSEYTGPGERLSAHEYGALLAVHDPLPRLGGPADEWGAIAVSCTSGTTGDPKGVVTHNRGAYLNAVGNVVIWTKQWFPPYLWTVALQGGVQVRLRRVEAGAIMGAMREHGVDHYCAAPIRHNLIISTDPRRAMTSRIRCAAWWPSWFAGAIGSSSLGVACQRLLRDSRCECLNNLTSREQIHRIRRRLRRWLDRA